MKKYNHEPNGALVPDENGNWVRAEAAENLYDALDAIGNLMDYEHFDFAIASEIIFNALMRADYKD